MVWAFSLVNNAYADENDVLRPYINLSYLYDDNIRRLSNSQQALAYTGSKKMSDGISTGTVGIIFDKKISQQEIYIDLNAYKAEYSSFSNLNYDGNEFTGRWNWHIGNHLEGLLEEYRVQTALPFASFQGIYNTVNYTQNRSTMDLKWHFHPDWQLRSELQRYEVNYNNSSLSLYNRTEDAIEVGVDYLPSTNSHIGVQLRHVTGELPVHQQIFIFSISNNYDQNEFKANVDWAFSDKTSLQFVGGIVDRKYDQVSERNYTGFNARGSVKWLPTVKTVLSLTGFREIGSVIDVTSTYTLSQGVSADVSWETTNKVSMNGNVTYQNLDFIGDAIFGSSQRSDTLKSGSISFVYKPIKPVTLNASLTRSDRTSTISSYDFTSNAIMFSAQYEF